MCLIAQSPGPWNVAWCFIAPHGCLVTFGPQMLVGMCWLHIKRANLTHAESGKREAGAASVGHGVVKVAPGVGRVYSESRREMPPRPIYCLRC